ncbi:flippase-like domain-containing protein [bacterium]|nr:flippase-like domain-containing protein [bacterium]
MKKLQFAAKILISALLLFLIFRRFDFSRFTEVVGNADIRYLILALFVTPFIIAIKSIKWMLLLKGSGIKVSFINSFRSITGGMALGIMTPGRVGEVSRGLFLSVGKEVEIGGLVFVDRFIDLLSITLFSLWGVLSIVRNPTLTLFATGLSGTLLIFLFIKSLRLYIAKMGTRSKSKIAGKINKFVSYYGKVKRDTIFFTFLLSLFMYFLAFTQFYLLINGFDQIGFIAILKTAPLIQFMSVVPITLFGLGLREGTAIYLLSPFNVAEAAAFNASFLSFVFNILLTALIGVFFLPSIKLKK